MKMKAVFEVIFDSKHMWDDSDLKGFKSGPLGVMKYLYREEGLGIFNKDLKLVAVKKVEKKP